MVEKDFGMPLIKGFVLAVLIIGMLAFISLVVLNNLKNTDVLSATGNATSNTFLAQVNVANTLSNEAFTHTSMTVKNQTWLDFDGVNGPVDSKGINLSDEDYYSPWLNGNKSTFSLWINVAGWTAGDGSDGRRYAFSKARSTAGYSYEYDLSVANTSQPNSQNIYFRMLDGAGTVASSVGCVVTYTVNSWHYCSIVMDGAIAYGYGDNSFVSSGSINNLDVNGTGDLRIGERAGWLFNGSIDQFKIYSEPLSAAAVRQQYQLGGYGDTGKFIPVLMLHQYLGVAPQGSVLQINQSQLIMLMDFFDAENYTTITDFEYYNWTQGNVELPENPVMMIWDDSQLNQWVEAAEVMAPYGQKSVIALTTGLTTAAEWINASVLINDYNWSIASHSQSHCHLGDGTGGTVPTWCNDTISMRGNLSQSKQDIIDNTGLTPITFVHTYNDWNADTMGNASDYYLMAFGSAAGANPIHQRKAKFIDKNSGYFTGELTRIEISNITTLEDLNIKLNKTYKTETLVLNLGMNENQGVTSHDLSTNAKNASIIGTTWGNDNINMLLTPTVDYSTTATTATLLAAALSWSEIIVNYNIADSDTNANQRSANVLNNISDGTESLFSNSGTWFSLLAVMVLILIISAVIIAVNQFNGVGGKL